MLVIRSQQMDHLRQQSETGFIRSMAVHCREYLPKYCESLNDEDLLVAARRSVTRAHGHGLTQRGPVRLFIDLSIDLGMGFDTDPLCPWATETLRRDQPQMKRMKRMHKQAVLYLTHSKRDRRQYYRDALELWRFYTSHRFDFSPERKHEQFITLISEFLPGKSSVIPASGIQTLIDSSEYSGQNRYGFRHPKAQGLLALLAVIVGHEYNQDPFLPWIEVIFQEADQNNPNQTAVQLVQAVDQWLEELSGRGLRPTESETR